jgi:hypothetical protein
MDANERTLRILRGAWLLVTSSGEDGLGRGARDLGERLKAAVTAGDVAAAAAIREEARNWWEHMAGTIVSRGSAALQEPGRRRGPGGF